jgi:hypothetical protein
MSLGGTWEADTFLSLPNVKIGIAPLPLAIANYVEPPSDTATTDRRAPRRRGIAHCRAF